MNSVALTKPIAHQQPEGKRASEPKQLAVIYDTAPSGAVAVEDYVSRLIEANFEVLVFTTEVGALTQFLSRNSIYYYLMRSKFGKNSLEFSMPIRAMFQLITAISSDLSGCRPSVVLCTGQSPLAFAARIASVCVGVPAVVEARSNDDDPRLNALSRRIGVCDASALDQSAVVVHFSPRPLALATRIRAAIIAARYLFVRNNTARSIYLSIRRLMEFAASVALLLLLSPLLLPIAAARSFTGKPALTRTLVHGQADEAFELLSFAERDGVMPTNMLQWLPSLINIVEGQLSVIGPRVMPRRTSLPVAKYWVRPGLIGWAQLKATPTATQVELAGMDDLYIGTLSPILDLKLLLLAAWRLARRK